MQPENLKPRSILSAPIESAASVFSSTDNPIPLVDWIDSFLKTLEQFNGIVDKIVTVRIIPCPASPSMLTRCLDSSLHTSSVDYPLIRSQGLAVALHRRAI